MSKFYCREFASMAKVQASKEDIAAPLEPGVDQAALTLSGSSQQSAAFAEASRFIGITADGIFSYKIGDSPTVTTDMMRVTAGQILYLGIVPGQKIAVISNT